MDTMTEMFGEPISIYTWAQAINDGQLIDVSESAREAGIRYPVAVTPGVWEWIDPRPMPGCQDMAGRLWDVLTMLRYGIRRSQGGMARVSVLFAGGPGLRGRTKRRVEMVAICGPGDDAEPVITIQLADGR